MAERLKRRADRAGLQLAPGLAAPLAAYAALLFRWNERMNLTALGADDEGLDRVVVEPLLALPHIPCGAAALVDIGSGGGSPAIPIKIAQPRLFVRMVEARARKAAFLREAVRRLKLDDVVVERCRYEELLNRADLQSCHDVLTVRGVRVSGAEARRLEELVKAGGLLLFFGGGRWSRGGREVFRTEAEPGGKRGIVVVRKRSAEGVGAGGV